MALSLCRALVVCAALLPGAVLAQPAAPAPVAGTGLKVELEPKALDLLKTMSATLAAAKTMSFRAVTTYESAARTGLPLAYTTVSYVTLQRPNKLRVITPGDGRPYEFYADGKTVMAYAPDENLVAVADVTGGLQEVLQQAFKRAAIYFPFTDVIVPDPFAGLSEGLKVAFVVGTSGVVGGTRTDIVAIASNDVQMQIWIGAKDHLPRMLRAVFFDEPGQYRHVVEFSDWRLNGAVPDGAFHSDKAAKARPMPFQHPEAGLGPMLAPAAKGESKP